MFTKDELLQKLNDFLKEKNTTVKSTIKDYKVDIMYFINWYMIHKHLPDRLLYATFLNSLNNTELSTRTKRRRSIIVGEYLVYIDCYSSTHLIVKTKSMVRYFDLKDNEIFFNGKKVQFNGI